MKWLVILVVACSSPAKQVEPIPAVSVPPPDVNIAPFRLEILDLRARTDQESRARVFTSALRAAAHEHPRVTMEWTTAPIRHECANDAPQCMAELARSLPVDRLIWGFIDGSHAELRMLIVDTEQVIEWMHDALPLDDAQLGASAREAIARLVDREP